MRKAVIITDGHFPEGDAGAIRLLFVAKAMKLSGYQVTVLCRGKYGNGCIDGIEYIALREQNHSFVNKLAAYLAFPRRVSSRLTLDAPDCIYIYNAPISVFHFCKAFSQKTGCALVYDCVEWYSPEQFKWNKLAPGYIIKNRIVTKTVDQAFAVIAISRYLEQYFRSKGIRTLYLPMLCEVGNAPPVKYHTGQLHIFYAGSPQSKDLVGNLLEAALLLTSEEQSRLKVTIVGSTREHLIKNCGISGQLLDACSGFLELHGRKTRNEVLRMLASADFVQLIRDPEMRYAKAGFPSKVVESLAHATPVFCNLSSDLGDYLRDGENALIAASHNPKDLAHALRRGLALTPQQKEQMDSAAFKTAKEHFDYRNWSGSIYSYLQIE